MALYDYRTENVGYKMKTILKHTVFWIWIIISFISSGFSQGQATPKDAPQGYEQILRRGAIAAINNPEYVSAKDADIRSNTWVLGVVIEGQARAYSLNLLNSHEVVNDQIGDTKFAAVW